MQPSIATLTDALTAVTEAAPGRQRQVRIKRALRAAVALDVEKDALEAKLYRQWDALDEMCRNSETDPEYMKRESVFFKTLAAYESACNALNDARTVLLS